MMISWKRNYDPESIKAALDVQPASVDTAIFAFGIYIPLALFVIMFILLKKYDLEKRYPEIVAELQKRKEAEKK